MLITLKKRKDADGRVVLSQSSADAGELDAMRQELARLRAEIADAMIAHEAAEKAGE